MWKIIINELNYHKNSLLVSFVVIPLFFYWRELDISSRYDFLLGFFLIVVISKINSVKKREKRNRTVLLLPVSLFKISLVRIMEILIPSLIVYIEILIIGSILKLLGFSYYLEILYSSGFIMFVYGLYFVCHDILVHYSKRIKFIVRLLIILIPVFLLMLGIIFFKQLGGSGGLLGILKDFMEVVKEGNPFTGFKGAIRFVLMNVCLFLFSIVTFMYRKSYQE